MNLRISIIIPSIYIKPETPSANQKSVSESVTISNTVFLFSRVSYGNHTLLHAFSPNLRSLISRVSFDLPIH
ncbi:hypothetical protein RJT34_12004 [Clitoria ternatea]|uniref:Uncharacterized protein n=1 Tax=Clitoria ternatea TaxID=43366 RepID=A0AAN9PK93_CLITE